MHHHRILSRDEWFPARRRRLGEELAGRRPLHAELHRNERGAPCERADRARHHAGVGDSVGATAPQSWVGCCGSGADHA